MEPLLSPSSIFKRNNEEEGEKEEISPSFNYL